MGSWTQSIAFLKNVLATFFISDKFKSLCTCVEGFELIRLVKGHQLNIQKRDLLHIQLRNNLDIRKMSKHIFAKCCHMQFFTLILNLMSVLPEAFQNNMFLSNCSFISQVGES